MNKALLRRKAYNNPHLSSSLVSSHTPIGQLVLHKQYGFTLIELMIVVGIIGLLVAIAIPKFVRYQAKARQSEAKFALAGVFGLENAFYSEYSSYIGDLNAIGYQPEGNKRFYGIGWDTCSATGSVTGYAGAMGNCFIPAVNIPSGWNIFPSTAIGPWPAAGLAAPFGALINSQGFIAVAAGQIQDDMSGPLADGDYWTIDSNKTLINGCGPRNYCVPGTDCSHNCTGY